MSAFADACAERIARSPLCVGIDPRPASLPPALALDDPEDLEAALPAVRRFCEVLLDVATSEGIGFVKPQVAFFEALGPAGMALFADVLRGARERGLLAIADVKRGDIGSTAAAYADAYLGPRAPFRADAITCQPYLGRDALEPFVRRADEAGAGLFVLVRTSNPGARDLQELPCVIDDGADASLSAPLATPAALGWKRRFASSAPAFERVASWLRAWNETRAGASGYGPVGAVVGATAPELGAKLRAAMPRAILLVPGVGAQGGDAAELGAFFDPRGGGAIVPVSRGIADAWRESGLAFADAARERIRELRGALAASTGR